MTRTVHALDGPNLDLPGTRAPSPRDTPAAPGAPRRAMGAEVTSPPSSTRPTTRPRWWS